MDKFYFITFCIVVAIIFGWLYINTLNINNYIQDANIYQERIDSLENKVNQLEYYILNQPKQINITVKNK